MKIITWNVNGIRAVAKKGFFEFVEQHKPDILCLQETKARPDQLGPDLFHLSGYKSFWSSAQKAGYSGTATYVREELAHQGLSVSHGIGTEKYDSEGRFVITDHGSFVLYNVYFPNGASGPERHSFKQEFLKDFLRHLQEQVKNGKEIILVGDYNIAYLDIDVFDAVRLQNTSGFLLEERQWMRQLLDSHFVDLFRKFHPEARHRYTWWSYFEKARLGNRGWRIDYISATQKIAEKATYANQLEDQMGSDHCPVLAEFKF